MKNPRSSSCASPWKSVARSAAFEVDLPPGFHVSSNVPLEEFLRPTRLLLDAPAGVRVREVVYPEPALLRTQFSERELSVFENRFLIGVAIELDADAGVGERAIPVILKYHARTERVCFPPATKGAMLRLAVVSGTRALPRQHADIFEAIPFSPTQR